MTHVPRRKGRVLVVEDEDTIGQVLVETLADEGYDVRRAEHGCEALDILKSWVPDLILLDLMMPVMDGWAFREAQRQLGGGVAEVPIIILSAARETSTRAIQLGAIAALSKPFELNDVVGAIRQWMPPGPAAGP